MTALRLAPLPKSARKFIASQTEKQRKAIYDALKQICESPTQHSNPTTIKRLKGRRHGQWRFRLGDIRIIYTIDTDKKTIQVVALGQRGGVYRAP